MLPAKVATRAIAPRSLACRWGTKCALVEYDRCFPAIVRWARLPSPPTWRWARSKAGSDQPPRPAYRNISARHNRFKKQSDRTALPAERSEERPVGKKDG